MDLGSKQRSHSGAGRNLPTMIGKLRNQRERRPRGFCHDNVNPGRFRPGAVVEEITEHGQGTKAADHLEGI